MQGIRECLEKEQMVHQIELLQAENKEKDSKIAEQQAKLELKDLQYAELQKQLKNTESSSWR